MNLEAVRLFHVPDPIVADTLKHVVDRGTIGHEVFILWTGIAAGPDFIVRSMHVPEQRSFKLASGLCVRVEGQALHQLNVWLYENHEVLGVQVHSHPTHAFHSKTDDAFPIVTALGGLSIVTPDFGLHGLVPDHAALFRLSEDGWSTVTADVLQVA